MSDKQLKKLEIPVVAAMTRASTPQTGWDIYQKIGKRFGSLTGNDFCSLMKNLSDRGWLSIVGCDDDCGYEYVLSNYYKQNFLNKEASYD